MLKDKLKAQKVERHLADLAQKEVFWLFHLNKLLGDSKIGKRNER